jgi:hypothetical protein
VKTKKGEKERLRTVILDKAVQFLKRHGRVGSGTNQMMLYAGLTRGALYSHFKSKDDLFAQAICHDLSRLEETQAKATNLYSGLAGTLTMARTMRDPRRAREILESGKKFLIETFVPAAPPGR